jgi:nucleoside-diphosphate-sugar epimerase
LVYTSTLDVVVDGRKPICCGDETLSYPKKLPKDHYCRTKILAEQLVLEANNERLKTCALRPVGMYGPRDKYHIANIIEMVKNGLRIRLGDGSARFSHVYSENAAHAHVLAARHLAAGSPVCGSAYFICDHQPASNLFDFMEPFLDALGLPAPDKKIPYWLAYCLASLVEALPVKSNFNRFAIVQTCVDHTFVSDRAEADFGYTPIISKEEAFNRTVAWFKRNSP